MPDTNDAQKVSRTIFDNLWDMIILNIVFIFTALPILTYGSAYSALFTCVQKLPEKKKYDPTVKEYWEVFKKSLKNSIRLWSLILSVLVVLAVDLVVVLQINSIVKYCYIGLIAFLFLLTQIVLVAGLPMCVSVKYTVKEVMVKAFRCFGAAPARILLAVVLHILPFLLVLLNRLWFSALFLVWEVIYFSFEAMITARLIGEPIKESVGSSPQEEK